jgi:hypothetical protein
MGHSCSKRGVFETSLFPSPANNIPHDPPDIALRVFNPLTLLFLSGLSRSHFRSRCQGQNTQEHPTSSKELITSCRCCHCPNFFNISACCQLWLLHVSLHNLLPKPFCLAGTGTVYLTPRIPPSPKPFGCPPVVGQGLTESAPPGRPRVCQPSKKSKGRSPCSVTPGLRGMQQQVFR